MAQDFTMFPSMTFVDLGMYQFGREDCEPAHSFGPAIRNHYLFHYILGGKGIFIWKDSRGHDHTEQLRAGQGFLISPGQITTYIADDRIPWEYCWIEFDGLRAKESLELMGLSAGRPVYNPVHHDFEEKMKAEMLYIVKNKKETPFHLIGHLYIFLDALTRQPECEMHLLGVLLVNTDGYVAGIIFRDGERKFVPIEAILEVFVSSLFASRHGLIAICARHAHTAISEADARNLVSLDVDRHERHCLAHSGDVVIIVFTTSICEDEGTL